MTPLAHKIVRDTLLPPKKQKFKDYAHLAKDLTEAHFFECTAIAENAIKLGNDIVDSHIHDERVVFLPAQSTWIEIKFDCARIGFLIQEVSGFANGRFRVRLADSESFESYSYSFFLDATSVAAPAFKVGQFYPDIDSFSHSFSNLPNFKKLGTEERKSAWVSDIRSAAISSFVDHVSPLVDRLADHQQVFSKLLLGALACINTPRIIGRRQHMPHRGLERDLLKRQKVVGQFPLHAWTEIVLDVTPPEEAAGMHEYEAHLSGKRALHFVRAHLRIWNGSLVFVSAHWRGEGALGIRRSRYRMIDEQKHGLQHPRHQ